MSTREQLFGKFSVMKQIKPAVLSIAYKDYEFGILCQPEGAHRFGAKLFRIRKWIRDKRVYSWAAITSEFEEVLNTNMGRGTSRFRERAKALSEFFNFVESVYAGDLERFSRLESCLDDGIVSVWAFSVQLWAPTDKVRDAIAKMSAGPVRAVLGKIMTDKEIDEFMINKIIAISAREPYKAPIM